MSNYYQKALSGSGIKLSARNRAQENQKLEAVMRLAIVTLFTAAITSGAALAAEPTGDWQVEDGSAVIRVESCRGALWGVVAWERVPGRDERSGRPTLGSAVLINMRASSQTRWDGQIYNAQNGQTYNANVRMVGDNTLRVEGCVMGGVFCGGQRWTRVGNASGGTAQKNASGGSARNDVCSRVSELSGRAR
jgi:uncharacterized protein (DUF2147 family)